MENPILNECVLSILNNFASLFNGRELKDFENTSTIFKTLIDENESNALSHHDLCVIYRSDGQTIIQGAIDDELDHGHGCGFLINNGQLVNSTEKNLKKSTEINVEYNDYKERWTYWADENHVKFDIMAGDRLWCRGIIIAISQPDAPDVPTPEPTVDPLSSVRETIALVAFIQKYFKHVPSDEILKILMEVEPDDFERVLPRIKANAANSGESIGFESFMALIQSNLDDKNLLIITEVFKMPF